MDNDIYYNYISYFITKIIPLQTSDEYKKLIDVMDVKNNPMSAAHHLYVSYVVSSYTTKRAYPMALNMSTDQMIDLFNQTKKVWSSFNVWETTITEDLDEDMIESEIVKIGSDSKICTYGYNILMNCINPKTKDVEHETKTTSKPTATKPTAAKPTASKPTAAKPTAIKPTAIKPTAKSEFSGKAVRGWVMKDYTKAQLIEIAKNRGITGYSNKNKTQLCEMLRIRRE